MIFSHLFDIIYMDTYTCILISRMLSSSVETKEPDSDEGKPKLWAFNPGRVSGLFFYSRASSSIRNTPVDTQDQRPGTRDLRSETRNPSPKPETGNQKPETGNRKPGTENRKPESVQVTWGGLAWLGSDQPFDPAHQMPNLHVSYVFIYIYINIHTYIYVCFFIYVHIYLCTHWYTYKYTGSAQLSIREQRLRSNGKQFQGGLVFKAHRLLYHSNLGRE